MGRKLHICGPAFNLGCVVMTADVNMLPTSVGLQQADSLTACTKAAKQLTGADANGHVDYTSRHGGAFANTIRVSHSEGLTGAGQESRVLDVGVTAQDVDVVYGTDGSGGSVVPTATQVADLVNADAVAKEVVTAAAAGTGTSAVNQAALTNLEGGLDDGDWYKFDSKHPIVHIINTIEVV